MLTVRAPPSRSSGFLSIERQDPRPPRIGDSLILNLRDVGVSEASFSHYYYMVCMSWIVEEGSVQGRAAAGESPWAGGAVSRLEVCSEEGTTLAPDSVPGPDRVCESRAQEDPDLRLRVCGPSPGAVLLLCGLLLS